MHFMETNIPNTFQLNALAVKSIYDAGRIRNANGMCLDTVIHYMMLGGDEFNDARISQCTKEEKAIKDIVSDCYQIFFIYTSTPRSVNIDHDIFLKQLVDIVNHYFYKNTIDLTYTIMNFTDNLIDSTESKNPMVYLSFSKRCIYLKLFLTRE